MEKKEHSGFGIASFILSIITLVSFFVLIGVAEIIYFSTPGGIDESSTEAIIMGIIYILLFATAFIAFGFGIAGLLNKNRKIVFSVIGLILSVAILIFLTVLIIVSL